MTRRYGEGGTGTYALKQVPDFFYITFDPFQFPWTVQYLARRRLHRPAGSKIGAGKAAAIGVLAKPDNVNSFAETGGVVLVIPGKAAVADNLFSRVPYGEANALLDDGARLLRRIVGTSTLKEIIEPSRRAVYRAGLMKIGESASSALAKAGQIDSVLNAGPLSIGEYFPSGQQTVSTMSANLVKREEFKLRRAIEKGTRMNLAPGVAEQLRDALESFIERPQNMPSDITETLNRHVLASASDVEYEQEWVVNPNRFPSRIESGELMYGEIDFLLPVGTMMVCLGDTEKDLGDLPEYFPNFQWAGLRMLSTVPLNYLDEALRAVSATMKDDNPNLDFLKNVQTRMGNKGLWRAGQSLKFHDVHAYWRSR
jgi:hypothetical protein